ncbi:MAG TPA: MFS transporter [Thermomicrobiales bacterium]|nr:MFS transporter [Thermomicrobiales bacterium]
MPRAAKPPERGEWPRSLFTSGMLASFAEREYRLLWTGTVVTQFGQWMQQVAVGWLILELTNSSTYLGVVGFARGVPMLFLALPAGVMADRIDRRTLLMFFQGAGAAVAVLLSLLVVFDWVRPWHVVVLSILGGAVMAFIAPTRQAMVPGVVPRDLIANAVAMNSAGQNATRVVGPSLAGVLISTVGTAICFVAQAFTFVWALVMSYQLRPMPAAQHAARASVRDNVADGLNYIRGNTMLSGLMIMAAVPILLAQPYMQMMPVFARDVLDAGSSGLGLLMAASGFGALSGALLYGAYGQRIRRQGMFQVATAAGFGLTLALFAISPWFILSLVLVALTGAVSAVYMAANNTVIQMAVADEYRGRVMSIYMMTWGLMPFGTLPMGWLSDIFGAPAAVAGQALFSTLVVVLVAYRLPRLRALEADRS